MFRLIIRALEKAIKKETAQSEFYKMNAKSDESEIIKVYMPFKYLGMLLTLVKYGIESNEHLEKIILSHRFAKRNGVSIICSAN